MSRNRDEIVYPDPITGAAAESMFQWRRAARVSAAQLAGLCTLAAQQHQPPLPNTLNDHSTISKVEAGGRKLTALELYILSQVMQLPMEEVIGQAAGPNSLDVVRTEHDNRELRERLARLSEGLAALGAIAAGPAPAGVVETLPEATVE
ncbi:MAG TPA: hypothetical protein VLF69_06155 [Candidatus Saccharimonadales bacterium]|nr:hypothetical protein [Candidatus Saccharimonadales bacterium]